VYVEHARQIRFVNHRPAEFYAHHGMRHSVQHPISSWQIKIVVMNRVLLIGGTGRVGRQLIEQLPVADAKIRVLTRHPEAARLPAHVEVVGGDLTIPESLDRCLEQIDAVFLVWVAPGATIPTVVERISRRAERIVFLSSPLKTAHPFFQQPNPLRVLGEQIERTIEASGLPWTFLRPGMFASNALRWWAPRIRAGDVVRWPYLAVPTAPIDERDIAAVAVRALLENGHAGAEYVLTGPQSLTQFEQVSTIARVIGRSLNIEELSPDEARRELLTLMPLSIINMLLDAWAAAAGQPALVTSQVEDIVGTPARTFLDWVASHASEFRP
jgi:uncharacterized protein YbjT (DUF2867 family)